MFGAAAAAALLSTAVPALPRGLPGDRVLARPGHAGAASAIVDQTTPKSQQSAPAAVLQESERLTSRPRTHEAASSPLDLEAWQGTLCLKGAWTLRASQSPDEPQGQATKRPTWQMP